MKSEELIKKYCELNPGSSYSKDIGTLTNTLGREEMDTILIKCIKENKKFQICYRKDTLDGGYVRYLNI